MLTASNTDLGAVASEGAAALAAHLDRVSALAEALGTTPATILADVARLEVTATRLRAILTMKAERLVHDAWAERFGLVAPQQAGEDASADIFF